MLFSLPAPRRKMPRAPVFQDDPFNLALTYR